MHILRYAVNVNRRRTSRVEWKDVSELSIADQPGRRRSEEQYFLSLVSNHEHMRDLAHAAGHGIIYPMPKIRVSSYHIP